MMSFFQKLAKIKIFIILTLFLIGYFLIFLISYSRSNYFFEHIENFSPFKVASVFVIMLSIFFSYAILFFDKKILFPEKALIISGLIILISFATFPFLSRDAGFYLIAAKNLVFFHSNPYVETLNSVQGNSWILESNNPWLHLTYPYGPLFIFISAIAVLPNFVNLISAYYFYKLVALVVYLLSIFLFIKINSSLKNGKHIAFLYALNPAILIHGLLGAHLEIFIILFLLISLYLLFENKWENSLFYFMASVFIKYITIIFLPIFWKRNGQLSPRRIVASSLLVISAFFILSKFTNFFMIQYAFMGDSCFYNCSPIVSFSNWAFGGQGIYFRLALFGIFYALVFFKFILKKDEFLKFIFWSFLMLIFFTTKWIGPWYILPIIPIGLLIPGKTYRAGVLFCTFYSLFHFFGKLYPWLRFFGV